MKKQKKNHAVENESIHQWRKSFALGKRKEAREKQKENAELERRTVFRRKTASASDKRAPVTLRTRSYYRFTKEYPFTVDENGFRENAPGKKAVRRRVIITLAVCIAVFAAAFVFAKSCMLVSQKTPQTGTVHTQEESRKIFRALRFTHEEFAKGDISAMTGRLDELNCSAAVFELKDDFGYVMFNTGSFMGMSADKRIKNAAATVKAVKARGYTVCAYISCFKDTAASRADLTFSVRRSTDDGDAWLDNSGAGWLDPFSPDVKEYLLSIIDFASKTGFDRIILGNVCFPADSGTASQHYAWESSGQLSRNQALISFIGSAVKSSGSAKLTVMCGYSAFDPQAGADIPGYYGSLISCAASSMCIDARLSRQQKNITVNGTSFSDASFMPYVFVLAASEYAVKVPADTGRENGETLVCIENGSALDEETAAVEYSCADGYIIW